MVEKHWLGHGGAKGHVVRQAGDQPIDPLLERFAGVKVCVAGAETSLGFKIVNMLAARGVPVRALVNSTTEVWKDASRDA